MDAAVDLLDAGAPVGLLVPPPPRAVAAAADAHAAVEAVPRHEDHHEDEHQDGHETEGDGDARDLAALQGSHAANKVSHLRKMRQILDDGTISHSNTDSYENTANMYRVTHQVVQNLPSTSGQAKAELLF